MKKAVLSLELATKMFKGNDPELRAFAVENYPDLGKDIKDRINDFSDILSLNNMSQLDFENRCENKCPHEIGALKEELIVSAYNEGVKPDYSDGTIKYCPIFNHSGGFSFYVLDGWNSVSGVGSRRDFCGPNALANLRDAVTKFLPEYKESRTL